MSRPKVGLALGAGGTKGAAHVGVLKVLDDAGIPIDYVAGCSAGALYGASYAMGRSPDAMKRGLRRTKPGEVVGFFRSRLRIEPGNPVADRFFRALKGVRFEELKIPLAVVTSDVVTKWPVVLREGEVLPAVQASIAIPLLAEPVEVNGRYLVDGGFWEAAPVQVAADMGADVVIAVVLGGASMLPGPLLPLGRRLEKALELISGRSKPGLRAQLSFFLHTVVNTLPPAREAELTIYPDVARLNANSPFQMRLALRRGEEAARAALPAVEELLAGRSAEREPVVIDGAALRGSRAAAGRASASAEPARS
jgi:NTE family protein